MTKAVIYARYSSDNQKETSIEDQLRLCREYAARNGMSVVHEYCDKAKSGTSVKRRTQFNKMLSDSELGRFECVLVYATNRFARNTYDSFVYRHQLRENGVEIVSITEPMPEGDVGDLVEYLFSWEAAQYSKNLSKVVKRRLDQRAAECKANGARLYGYRNGGDGCYEVVEEEAAVVRRVFTEWADGRQAAEIVDDLNRDRIPNSNGREWQPHSIQHMIRNERYLGVYKWGGVRVEGGMPAIVSRDLFESAKNHARHKSKHTKYLLTGKVYCPCGKKLLSASGTSKSGKRYRYYRCNACKSQIASERLEDMVLDITAAMLGEPAVVETVAKAVVEQSEKRNDVDAIRDEISEVEKKIERGVSALLNGLSSETMEAELQKLEARKSDLHKRLAAATGHAVTMDSVMSWLMQYDCSDSRFNEAIIEHLVERVIYDGEEVVIAYRTGDACSVGDTGALSRSGEVCSYEVPISQPLGISKNTLKNTIQLYVCNGFLVVTTRAA